MKTFKYTVIALSFYIPLCVVLMDILALCTTHHDVHEEFKNWFITNGTGIPPDELYSAANDLLIVDGAILLVSIVTLIITGTYYCCSSCCCSAPPTYCDTMSTWCLLVFPIANFATHFNQISLGFIHTHQHAVCAALLYAALIAYVSLLIFMISYHAFSKCSYQCECLCTVSVSLLVLAVHLFSAIIFFFNQPDVFQFKHLITRFTLKNTF